MRICAVCFAMLLVVTAAAEFPKPLQEAVTREELVKHFGTTIGFGEVEKWEFTTGGRKLMVFGYCPFSGRAACYVHAYYYNTAKQRWLLFLDRLVEPATGLSAEISADHSLIFKDRGGKIVANHSIDALPK